MTEINVNLIVNEILIAMGKRSLMLQEMKGLHKESLAFRFIDMYCLPEIDQLLLTLYHERLVPKYYSSSELHPFLLDVLNVPELREIFYRDDSE